MDWIFLGLLVLVIGVGIYGFIKQYFLKPKNYTPDDFAQKSPYEKMVAEQNLKWQIGFQTKQVIRNKQLLRDALKKGNETAAKVHKGMIVYGRSVVNHLRHKFKEN